VKRRMRGLIPGLSHPSAIQAPHLPFRHPLPYREREVKGGSAVTRERKVKGSFSRTASFLSPVFHAKPLHTPAFAGAGFC